MTRAQLVERILFAVDGYQFSDWTLAGAVGRILELIEAHPEAVS